MGVMVLRKLPASGPIIPTRVAPNGTAFSISTNNANTHTATYPPASSAGDFLIMQVQVNRNAATTDFRIRPENLTGGAEWHAFNLREDVAQACYFFYFWCFRGSETSVSIASTVGTAATSANMLNYTTTIVAYVGSTVDSFMPLGDSVLTYRFASDASVITTPTLISQVDNCEVLALSAGVSTSTYTSSWTNATELTDNIIAGASQNYQQSSAYNTRPTAGTTPTYSMTPSTTSVAKAIEASVVQPPITGFPVVVRTLTGFAEANGTSTSITLPPTNSGDLILVEFQADGSQTISTTSSGWTKIGQYANSTLCTLGLFAGIAGTAGALTITNTSSLHRIWTIRVIRNWSGLISDIKVANTAATTSSTPNPPALTPTAGLQNYLWGAIAVSSQNSTYPIAAPAGWGVFSSIRCLTTTASTAHIGQADAWLRSRASTMDPPTFTGLASGSWIALTIAVK